MKRLKEILEKNSADDYVAPKDSDKEATDYEPRSKKEKELKNKLTSGSKDKKHPVATKNQFKGGTSKTTPNENKSAGEKSVVKGGTKVKKFSDFSSKQGEPRRGDNRLGDLKVVNPIKEGYSFELKKKKGSAKFATLNGINKDGTVDIKYWVDKKASVLDSMENGVPLVKFSKMVKEDIDLLNESVFEDLQKIVKEKQNMSVKFKNGKSIKVDTFSASAIIEAHKRVSASAKTKIETWVNESPEKFMRILDVAMGDKK